jgi:hypothetical protein
MNMQEVFNHLNWLAVITAAVSAFVTGGLWYSVLFAGSWKSVNNFTDEMLAKRNLPKVFGLSFLCSFIMALNLAMFIGAGDMWFGLTAGFLTGFGWVFFAIAIISLFENRPLKYVMINGGYMIVAFSVMGLIIGAWH